MVSLTTVYIVSVILTSIAGIGSSFAAKKIVGGASPPPVLEEEVPNKPLPSASIEEEVPNKPLPSASIEEEVPNKSVVSIPETDKEDGDPTMGGRVLVYTK